MNYWLMKTEPDVFSIDDLKAKPKKTDCWEGVRNYQARNFMRDGMKKNDRVLIYHSSCKDKGIAGIAKVVKESYPDHSAWDKKSPYYDPKSIEDNPRWFMVDIMFEQKFATVLGLREIKAHSVLKNMRVALPGQRLSIMPVTEKEFHTVLKLMS